MGILTNVNQFTGESVKLLIEESDKLPINGAEQEIKNFISANPEADIINYPFSEYRLMKLFPEVDNLNPKTRIRFLDHRGAFIDAAKKYPNTLSMFLGGNYDALEISCDILVSVNELQRIIHSQIDNYFAEIKSIKADKYLISFPISKDNGTGLTLGEVRKKQLGQFEFLNNLYSRDTVKSIAETYKYTVEFFDTGDTENVDYALLIKGLPVDVLAVELPEGISTETNVINPIPENDTIENAVNSDTPVLNEVVENNTDGTPKKKSRK